MEGSMGLIKNQNKRLYPQTIIIFKRNFLKALIVGKSATGKFLELQKAIIENGYTSYDLSYSNFQNSSHPWQLQSKPEHPFYVPKKGWTSAIDLRAGDIVVVEQVQHELLESPETTYNFEVEDYHTYYVGNTEVLVHNMCAKKRDIRQVEQAARELKMNDHQRHAFGDYIESLKWDLPNDKNFSYKELIEIGKAFLEAINDDWCILVLWNR